MDTGCNIKNEVLEIHHTDMTDVWYKLKQARQTKLTDKSFDMSAKMGQIWDEIRDDQIKFLNDWICSNTQLSYQQEELWDIIGIKPYTLES